MALGTPVAGAAAYSASGGTSVAPAYPSGILDTDAVLLFVGQKPSTANSGTVTTPTGWTLRDELTAAGGYGTTLGADTGNTNLRVYSWNSPVAGQTGTLSVTLGTNNVSWAFIVRIPTNGGALSYGSAEGQRTTTPTSPMSIALTDGATPTAFQTGDVAIWAMCIPTDVTTPAQFSAESITATGATFGTAVEINEPDSTTGNDIGGYSAYASVTAGSSTTAPTVTATLAGTLTNVRGPVVLLRVREAPVTHGTSGDLTGQIGSISGAADHQAASVPHSTTGALVGQGSDVVGSATRFRAHATDGALPGQVATITGAADRESASIPHVTTGTLTGQGSIIDGTAARTRQHATDGALSGGTATIVGAADHEGLTIPHVASGDLAGQGSAITGAAFVSHLHATSGDLVGPGAEIIGDADRSGPEPVVPVERGDGVDSRWTKKERRARDRKLAEERDRKGELRQLLKRALDPVTDEASVEVVTVDDGVVVIPAAGQPVAVPRPEGVDLRAMSREIGKILSDAKVQAERTRRAQSQEIARVAMEQARENMRRVMRKRRQEEFLLLMT